MSRKAVRAARRQIRLLDAKAYAEDIRNSSMGECYICGENTENHDRDGLPICPHHQVADETEIDLNFCNF